MQELDSSSSGSARMLDDEDARKIDHLTDIFPFMPRSSLVDRLQCNKDKSLEELVELLVLEGDAVEAPFEPEPTKGKMKDPEIQTLKEILPKHSMREIEHHYRLHNGDFDQIVRTLLEKERQTTVLKDNQFLSQELSTLTGRSVQLTTKYLLKNDGHFVKSLVDLVNHEIKVTREASSRVQRMRGNYTYDPDSPEHKEFHVIFASNQELGSLYKPFLIKLLLMLNNDYSKLIDICASIQESNLQEMTFEVPEPGLDGAPKKAVSPPYSTIPTKSQSNGSLFKTTTPPLKLPEAAKRLQKINKPTYAASSSSAPIVPKSTKNTQDTSTKQAMAAYKLSGETKLDLHGLTVDNALSATDRVVKQWWAQELSHRESEGRLDRYGSKGHFVQPVKIVTGRGIHSKDGISPIRVKVGKYLRQNKYQYEEESWGFEIYGKLN